LGAGDELMECSIILDSSALFVIAENLASLDSIYEIASECEVIVVKPVIEELKSIAGRDRSRKSLLAKWILQNLVPRFKVVDLNVKGEADSAILEYAYELKRKGIRSIIATTDGEVKEKALKRGIDVLIYRESERIFESP